MMKLKKPVVCPTFFVKFWFVKLMFEFVSEKVFEFGFHSIICQYLTVYYHISNFNVRCMRIFVIANGPGLTKNPTSLS